VHAPLLLTTYYLLPTIYYLQAALYVHALFAARDRGLGIIEANFVSLPARLLGLMQARGEGREAWAEGAGLG